MKAKSKSKTKKVQEAVKCPECGRKQGDLRWPVVMLSMGFGYFKDFLYCTNCSWDNLIETRKMSRETYQFLWQRYRLMWGRHLTARLLTRGYHAPQLLSNFMHTFIAPRWMWTHLNEAMNWMKWRKLWKEVQYPNHSLWDWHESREYHPETTFKEWLKSLKETREYEREHPYIPDDYDRDYE